MIIICRFPPTHSISLTNSFFQYATRMFMLLYAVCASYATPHMIFLLLTSTAIYLLDATAATTMPFDTILTRFLLSSHAFISSLYHINSVDEKCLSDKNKKYFGIHMRFC